MVKVTHVLIRLRSSDRARHGIYGRHTDWAAFQSA